MPATFKRLSRAIQTGILMIVLAWGVMTVLSALKRAFPLHFQTHPNGSYVAVTQLTAPHPSLLSVLSEAARETAVYMRLSN
ncbi:hypothetical protein JI721_15915 [Alicyclobacillus cycloheptanicus]|uniref:Uncharacterized protein n=1 Tax=Alicyclobacillus cycloheptanicus TaxID=1457 RepID=A0ABT9XDR3_9BACL|nr:hypothetical protein [Alicyclobacillus cycloheptanicus]MDQ0188428.1 hypothetical protein [Alicyclobacillus cycloheptanicus]WDM01130.1 hypothetical protein JI721_15915 [Alicyclobacillus cycloheptanicus]